MVTSQHCNTPQLVLLNSFFLPKNDIFGKKTPGSVFFINNLLCELYNKCLSRVIPEYFGLVTNFTYIIAISEQHFMFNKISVLGIIYH